VAFRGQGELARGEVGLSVLGNKEWLRASLRRVQLGKGSSNRYSNLVRSGEEREIGGGYDKNSG